MRSPAGLGWDGGWVAPPGDRTVSERGVSVSRPTLMRRPAFEIGRFQVQKIWVSFAWPKRPTPGQLLLGRGRIAPCRARAREKTM